MEVGRKPHSERVVFHDIVCVREQLYPRPSVRLFARRRLVLLMVFANPDFQCVQKRTELRIATGTWIPYICCFERVRLHVRINTHVLARVHFPAGDV